MIRNQYYRWLCEKIFSSKRRHYKRLVKYLHGVPFTYTIRFDENRAEDGFDLRIRFAYEKDYDTKYVLDDMGDDPCSVLEMMVALAIRCEDQIMQDPDIGDRTGKWFWVMVDSSGLNKLTDANFNSYEADTIINRILNRDYGPCGEGGLFYIPRCGRDLRQVEIWYQLYWYLDYYSKDIELYENIQ